MPVGLAACNHAEEAYSRTGLTIDLCVIRSISFFPQGVPASAFRTEVRYLLLVACALQCSGYFMNGRN